MHLHHQRILVLGRHQSFKGGHRAPIDVWVTCVNGSKATVRQKTIDRGATHSFGGSPDRLS